MEGFSEWLEGSEFGRNTLAAAMVLFSFVAFTKKGWEAMAFLRDKTVAIAKMVSRIWTLLFLAPSRIEKKLDRVLDEQAHHRVILDRLTENGKYATFQCDLEGRIVDVNALYCQWLDCQPRDLLGLQWRSFFTFEQLKSWDERWKPAMQEGRRFSGEMEFSNGVKVVADVIKLFDGAGVHVGYKGFMRQVGIEADSPFGDA